MAGRAGAIRAIAPSTTPHACPRQGRRRPTPRFYAAGEVIDFAFVVVYDLNDGFDCPRQGRWRPTPRFYAAGAGGVPPVQTYVGGGAPAAKLRPMIRTRPMYISAKAYLPLYRYSRPAVYLPSCSFSAAKASWRCWPWRTAMGTWPKQILRDRTRPHAASFARSPQIGTLEW
jgi:hypothetical protein